MSEHVKVAERFRLDGRVAVVTGGSRGIGFAVAQALVEQGARVVVASRSVDACEEAAQSIGEAAIPIACDVAEPQSMNDLYDRVAEELGGADILVHCAGVAEAAWAKDMERSQLNRMLDIHLQGGVHAAQRAGEQMRARGHGAILFVSSVFGLGGTPRMLAYGAAKAALIQAMRVLAVEWAADGIRVNALAPGFVDTDMTAGLSQAAREKILRRVPMGRAAAADEIASAALFLCSDAASYLTGQTLVVDGGDRAR